jgi:hypothetical protein
MTGYNHAMTGAAIALAVRQPLLAAPLAFLSHFVLDVTPHFGGTPSYEYGHKLFPIIIMSDALLTTCAVLVLCAFAPLQTALILLCALCAVLPDVLLFTYYTNGRPDTWFHRWHLRIQWFERPQGAIVEAAYAFFISTAVIALIWRG